MHIRSFAVKPHRFANEKAVVQNIVVAQRCALGRAGGALVNWMLMGSSNCSTASPQVCQTLPVRITSHAWHSAKRQHAGLGSITETNYRA